jgi:hypothetical protein
MLKINLLPPTINAGATRGKMIGLWIFLWIVTVGGFMFWLTKLNDEAARIKSEATALEPTANKADATQREADDINAKSAAVRAKADFIRNANEFNSTAYQTVVNNVRDYTIKSVLYRDMNISGNTVTLTAYAPSLAEVGRYLMWMEHNPSISNVSIAINSIPGFPYNGSGAVLAQGGGAGQSQSAGIRPPGGAGHDFSVTLTLVKPLPGAPAFPGAGGGGGQAGGGMGGGMTSGGGMLMGMGGGPGGGGGASSGGGGLADTPDGGRGGRVGTTLRNRGADPGDN